MDIRLFIQASYVGVAVTILLIQGVRPLRERLLTYGARGVTGKAQQQTKPADGAVAPKVSATDLVAALQVPHGWFMSFYAFSVLSSVFWAHQLLFKSFAFRFVVQHTAASAEESMTMQQMIVVWTMMLVQGSRRLDESLTLTKPSKSTMFIAHWLIGIWFYAMTGVAIWIEGVGVLKASSVQPAHLRFAAPNLRTFVSTILFMLASGIQRDCHAYLASLKTYKVPEHPAFNQVICPHYLAECVIYLALTIAAAPGKALVNRTMAAALFFVVVNLGVTADGTKKWYMGKFGAPSVGSRWRLIPFVF